MVRGLTGFRHNLHIFERLAFLTVEVSKQHEPVCCPCRFPQSGNGDNVLSRRVPIDLNVSL